MLRPKTVYIRNKAYLRHVRGQGCLNCGKPGEAHHVNTAMDRGIGLKVGDNWVAPLCHQCHMELHHFGDEGSWWDIAGIDPIAWATASWKSYREQNPAAGENHADLNDSEQPDGAAEG